MKEQLFQIGVKALIENEKGEILLLDSGDWHHKDQVRHWDIPGGRIQGGASVSDTLKREIEEETGIKKLKKADFFTAVVSNFKNIRVDNLSVGLALMIYKVEVDSNAAIKLSDEHTGFEWVNREDAAKRLAYKYPKEFTNLL